MGVAPLLVGLGDIDRLGHRGDVGALRRQKLDDFITVVRRREHEGRSSPADFCRVDVRAVLQEDGYGVGAARCGRQHERRRAHRARAVGVGSGVEEFFYYRRVSGLAGDQ